MKHIITLLAIIIASITPLSAQSIIIPQPLPQTPAFQRSSSQKNVALSTDIAAIALPVATLTGVLITKDWQGLRQGALTAVTTTAATYLLKMTVNKQRPDYSNYSSFPSFHTSASFATAAFLQRRYGWKLGAPAYAIAAYVGWGRVFSKKHDIWDVLAGAAIGAASAYIYTTPFARKHDLAIAPAIATTPDGTPSLALTASLSF